MMENRTNTFLVFLAATLNYRLYNVRFICTCAHPVSAGGELPDHLALPVHLVGSMLKALKMNSEEARLKFARLLQIIELYPSETLDLMTKEVCYIINKCRNCLPYGNTNTGL